MNSPHLILLDGKMPALVRDRRGDIRHYDDGRPMRQAWQKPHRNVWRSAELLARRGESLGIVPGSIGMFVVDIDTGGEAALAYIISKLGAPAFLVPTSAYGKWHCYYWSSESDPPPPENGRWGTDGMSGDLRHEHGYCKAWFVDADNPVFWDNLERFATGGGDLTAAMLMSLPRTTNGGAQYRTNPAGGYWLEREPLEAFTNPTHPSYHSLWGQPNRLCTMRTGIIKAIIKEESPEPAIGQVIAACMTAKDADGIATADKYPWAEFERNIAGARSIGFGHRANPRPVDPNRSLLMELYQQLEEERNAQRDD